MAFNHPAARHRYPPILDVWSSSSAVSVVADLERDNEHFSIHRAGTPAELRKAMASGQAQAILVTLDDILSAEFDGVAAQALRSAVWILIVVPEPHPSFEIIADRRLLVRAKVVSTVLASIAKNIVGTPPEPRPGPTPSLGLLTNRPPLGPSTYGSGV